MPPNKQTTTRRNAAKRTNHNKAECRQTNKQTNNKAECRQTNKPQQGGIPPNEQTNQQQGGMPPMASNVCTYMQCLRIHATAFSTSAMTAGDPHLHPRAPPYQIERFLPPTLFPAGVCAKGCVSAPATSILELLQNVFGNSLQEVLLVLPCHHLAFHDLLGRGSFQHRLCL